MTSHELLEKLGLDSTKTLTRWHKRGLIPPPEIGTHPNGRGKIAFWPDWVLDRCRQIRALVDQGKTLDEVDQILGTAPPSQLRAHSARYRMRDVAAQMDFDAAVGKFINDVLEQLAPQLVGSRFTAQRLTSEIVATLSPRTVIHALLSEVKAGIHPLLVYDGEQFVILPDFLAAQRLADLAKQGGMVLVLSLLHAVLVAFAQFVSPEDVEKAQYRPASIVEQMKDGHVNAHFQVLEPKKRMAGKKRSSAGEANTGGETVVKSRNFRRIRIR